MRRGAIVAMGLCLAVLLTGCTNEALAGQYASGSGSGYISGDGAYTEIPVGERDAPVVFSGTTETGATLGSADYRSSVYVVNFWYAGCPPCRSEAPDLAAVSAKNPKVPFVGVNILDTSATASTFAKKFGILYPSVIDTDASVQLAFAGSVAPNAVPTTIVIDRQGRVAARISGRLLEQSILTGMIDRVVAEAP